MTQGCQRMPGIWHPDTPEGSTHEAAQVWDLMAPFGGSGRRSLRWHLPLPAARTPGADFVLHERRWGAIALSKLGYFQQGCSCPSSHGCLLQGGKNPWRHSRFPPSPPLVSASPSGKLSSCLHLQQQSAVSQASAFPVPGVSGAQWEAELSLPIQQQQDSRVGVLFLQAC